MFRKQRQRVQLICERWTPKTAESLQAESGQKAADHPVRVIELRNLDGIPIFPFHKQAREGA